MSRPITIRQNSGYGFYFFRMDFKFGPVFALGYGGQAEVESTKIRFNLKTTFTFTDEKNQENLSAFISFKYERKNSTRCSHFTSLILYYFWMVFDRNA